MTGPRWVMNRAGLLNFWYYDNEIFEFADGKLLLRGSNGSGKSVTMQSFLPVLLDGKKTPDRLDPFGSKARRMEDYLLGEKEVVDRDERTGYLFMEYKMGNTEQYITTGIGMQAKRNKGIKSWYFIIKDNRRIGIDFYLTQKHLGEDVPLSAKELENRIAGGGTVVHTQREYMELVNKYVFGFSSTEAYEDLIKLLIQLRSPKLSKDFKPTVIYEILESALPPLTDDELRHLSDTIESMDESSQQIEQLERENDSVKRLKSTYHTYNQFILAERIDHWMKAQNKQEQAHHRVTELTAAYNQYGKEIEKLTAEQQVVEQKLSIAEQEQASLQNHEVWTLEKNRREKREEATSITNEIRKLEQKWDDLNKKLHENWRKKEVLETELLQNEQRVEEILDELSIDADTSAFHQHEINLRDYERSEKDAFDFTVWLKEAKEHETLLNQLEKRAEEIARLTEQHMKLQRQSSDQKYIVDELKKETDHLEEWFESEHQELETDIFQWIERHPELIFTKETQQRIARAIQGLYDETRYETVRDYLISAIHTYEADVKKDVALTENKIADKLVEIKETDAELERIKTQKIVEPDRAAGTNTHRMKLMEDGQAFLPFYAAVEFQEHVTEEQRERIEAVLKQTGILDSLITEQAIKPTEDAVIEPNPQLLGYTLADYLMPDLDEESPISARLVDEVLRSIPLEMNETGFHIDVDGTYSLGSLKGHAPMDGPSKYIGRTSRKRHQREQILLWKEKSAQLEQELDHLRQQLAGYQEKLTQANDWKRELPSDTHLFDIHEQILQKRREWTNAIQQLARIDDEWKTVDHKLHNEKKLLREQGMHLNIDLTTEIIEKALVASRSYIDFLYDLSGVSIKLSSLKRELATIHMRIEELQEELDANKGDQNSKTSQLSKIRGEIESIERQLQLKGIDEVRRRIEEVQEELGEAKGRLHELVRELPAKQVAQSRSFEKLNEAKTDFLFWQQLAAEWEKLVAREQERHYFPIESDDPETILRSVEGVYTKYDRSKVAELLTKTYYNELDFLTEYRMQEFTEELETPEWFFNEFGDQYEPYKNEWQSLKGRRLIQMEYRGARVSPYYVAASLESELEEKKHLLDEQDRQLYEDIIVNTVGTILRRRIQRAEQWVKEMDKIMEERDTSSGLSFSITWKPLTAESEDELDTKDLVQLLQRNSKFLSDEDLERITKHFRSRIAKAKELIQLRNEGSTLHQVLKEVLDYRKWFTFILYYKRVNETKRELTNNAFYRFSGGEKAMAMYIPLFTAAYSRYKEAGDTAPYIISLDEAFAGVDENNIRDMFEVVEQLGFNYIMNSQALWGDYDTISSLSICELVRPKNANYVTVIRYHWDGKQKSLIVDDSRFVSEASTIGEDLVVHE
ncbi:MAG: TIGR02680 family protein [Caldibacillus thermoamylovorans]